MDAIRGKLMEWKRGGKIALGVGVSLVLGAEAGWAAYALVRWLRYPVGALAPAAGPSVLDPYLPAPEVDERVSIPVDAPADATMAAARRLDFQRLPVARAIFTARALLLGAKDAGAPAGPFVLQVQALGWTLLAEEPGRSLVFGAATQPWRRDVVFRPVPAREFAAFSEPGYVKIAWTLRVEPSGAGTCVCLTETRVATTDPAARRKFRLYWAAFSPGILLIRRIALRAIKRAAERG
jgi:hypothetical protein